MRHQRYGGGGSPTTSWLPEPELRDTPSVTRGVSQHRQNGVLPVVEVVVAKTYRVHAVQEGRFWVDSFTINLHVSSVHGSQTGDHMS
jgi:hypothetical protein